MDIFKIGNDLDYFDLTFIDEKDVRLFSTFKGQKITLEWKEEIFALSEDNLQKNEILDFDARCFGSILLMKKVFGNQLKKLLSNEIEILPIKIKGVSEEFVFINILRVVPAIDFDGLDTQQSISMLKSKEIKFKLNEIKSEILFRDKKINYYYCTPRFIECIENNQIKGLLFEKVGGAK